MAGIPRPSDKGLNLKPVTSVTSPQPRGCEVLDGVARNMP